MKFQDLTVKTRIGLVFAMMLLIITLISGIAAYQLITVAGQTIQSTGIITIIIMLVIGGGLTIYTGMILQKIKDQLNERARSFKRSEATTRSIVNTSLDSILTIDIKGTILSCNTTAETMFGYIPDELLGQNIKILMPEPFSSAHDGYLVTYMAKKAKQSIWFGRELVGKRKDGVTFPIYISIGEVQTKNEVIFTGFIRDISEQKAAQEALQQANDDLTAQNWLSTQIAKITELTQGETDLQAMSNNIISTLSKLIEAGHGVMYVRDSHAEKDYTLSLSGSYAFRQRKNMASAIKFGEGLVGQCAKEKIPIHLTQVPPDYIQINSALGETTPLNLFVVPILFEQQLMGVIELASFTIITDTQQLMIERVTENIGIVINNIHNMSLTQKLLEETQRQGEELQSQQEALRASNENLEKQAKQLKVSEEEMQSQSEELRASNEELSKKSRSLEIQKAEIEATSQSLELKSQDLALASQYKSEFLANMSHELRTPLNSFLLLSKELSKNPTGNLDTEQIEDLRIIYEGGADLLLLINDIMDLSKVEAGKLVVMPETVDLDTTCANIKSLFKVSASNQNLEFKINRAADTPTSITTDPQRLEQVLKNFLSNAFKFTSAGLIELNIHLATANTRFLQPSLNARNALAFSVSDTGIGISVDKQKEIFEAFQQADGSTNRQYGGTGLGLTISKELARVLDGEIMLNSQPGKGSTFTLYLPLTQPLAVTPDLMPKVMSDKLFVSDNSKPTAIHSSVIKTALIVEDSSTSQASISQLIENKGIQTQCVSRASEVIEKISSGHFDCIILDIDLADINGFEVLETISRIPSDSVLPVIVYTEQTLSKEERLQLQKYSATVILKDAASSDKLLDEAIMFMHSLIDQRSSSQQKVIYNLHDETLLLNQRKILLVDDDMRNTFALSKSLQKAGLQVIEADNGQTALDKLNASDDIELIIMDIMMPIMDGYEAMRVIRTMSDYSDVPIIALTAKAMPEDRKLCIDAGATDYLTKPINFDKLLSMLKVWLFKK